MQISHYVFTIRARAIPGPCLGYLLLNFPSFRSPLPIKLKHPHHQFITSSSIFKKKIEPMSSLPMVPLACHKINGIPTTSNFCAFTPLILLGKFSMCRSYSHIERKKANIWAKFLNTTLNNLCRKITHTHIHRWGLKRCVCVYTYMDEFN